MNPGCLLDIRPGFSFFRGQKINANFFVQSFSKTLRAMDVRAKNRGRPHQKMRFSAAPVMGRNFLTQGRPGVRVRNVRGKSGPKSLCLCCFFFPDFWVVFYFLKVSSARICLCIYGPYPQYGRDFQEENSGKIPESALRAVPGIPLESTAGIPQALLFF